ncbi:uncharacterized protein B4U80_01289 [Leptotrombidium deliense]|uniref:Uncharacterized protein n=1 Tax=Leptotrombidium deliense TaxID=299467 RepID=A0A443SQ79_9ACAR|nr:uncharacterized protein B4U80_01289 [Leptotrombidium deliense]
MKTGKPREEWWKSVFCFRRANFSFEDRVVRCVAPRMLKEYKKMSKINCPNCEPYFHCKANYRAVNECGQTEEAVKLANIVTNCKEISKIGADDNASFEAAAKGRNGSDCDSLYLCAVKCSYKENTGSCSQASICSSSD